MATVRLTMAQALTRWMAAQSIEQLDGSTEPAFAGVWAIFGHGNVAGLGEALYGVRDELPTFRGHNEQGMAHIAIAYAKQKQRRRMMAVTTSIGPGATNLATAAALAHVNRLPVLLLPGDVFATRAPDPVLQQVESFADGTVSANDTLRPVSRFIDLPQAVDAAANNNAKAMLDRDIRNMDLYYGQYAPELENSRYSDEMWALFEAGDLTEDTELTGKFADPEGPADVDAVMAEIRAVLAEEERQAALAEAAEED